MLLSNLSFLPCSKQLKHAKIAFSSYHIYRHSSDAASTINTPLFTAADMANQFNFKFIT